MNSCSNILLLVLSLSLVFSFVSAQQFLYCGKVNCYDVLKIDRSAEPQEIRKAYRRLARELHPDKNKSPTATEDFQALAVAYETLKDEDSRSDYDYYLDHPEEFSYNLYRYYRKRAPKVDVWPVVVTLITFISIFQYWSRHGVHNSIIQTSLRSKKIRKQAKETAEREGLIPKKGKLKKEELEAILISIVERDIDLRGTYAPPKLSDVLWVQILISPYTIYKYFAWQFSWWYRLKYLEQDYSDDDKHYLIRKNFKLSADQYHCQPDKWKDMVWQRECWNLKNAQKYQQEMEEERREKLKNSGHYKRYKRYMKNREPDRFQMD